MHYFIRGGIVINSDFKKIKKKLGSAFVLHSKANNTTFR